MQRTLQPFSPSATTRQDLSRLFGCGQRSLCGDSCLLSCSSRQILSNIEYMTGSFGIPELVAMPGTSPGMTGWAYVNLFGAPGMISTGECVDVRCASHGRPTGQDPWAGTMWPRRRRPNPLLYRYKSAARYAVNVKLLPVAQSTSFSGISCLARSTKFCPLQCIGSTCSRSNFLSSAITLRR